MSIRSNVDARRLDERVTFQRCVETRSIEGELVQSWLSLVTAWAAVDGSKANRAEPASIGQMVLSESNYTIWVRADIPSRFSITLKDRIEWRGKLFNILDMPDQQLRGRLTAVICNVGLNQG